MIITKKYATKLIKMNVARLAGSVMHNDAGEAFEIVERIDMCRVDHYRVPSQDRTPN